MTYQEAMAALEKMSSPSIKKVLLKHGAVEPFFGVKIGDMKTIVKQVKKDHELSLQSAYLLFAPTLLSWVIKL